MMAGTTGLIGTVGEIDRREQEQPVFVFDEALDVAPAWSRAIAAWVNTDPKARILLSRSGRIQWGNDAAYRMLREDCGLKIVNHHLVARDCSTAAVLTQLLQNASHEAALYAITAMDGDRQWLFWTQQLILGDYESIGLAVHRMADPISYEAMLQLHHLTPSEAHIVTMMLSGLETGRIAQKQDISIETLRTHIKHAYRKLGIKSRGELFAKATDFAGL